jgi:hypothetical protein
MTPEPKTVTRKVKILTDPNPKFVSVVNHGAIQEPFTSLKHAEKGPTPMAIKPRPSAPTISSHPVLGQKAVAVGVRKIVFAKAQYTDEASVNKYLKGEGYDGYVVKADGETFVAEVEGNTDAMFEKVAKVAMGDGITGFVGTKVASTQKSAIKAEDTALKFDWYAAYCSKGETVADVLESGMADGVPPGVEVIFSSALTAIGNVLGGDDTTERATKVASICNEMGSMITAVDALFVAALASESAQKHENVKKFIDAHNAGVTVLTEIAAKKEPVVEPVVPAVPAVKAVDDSQTVQVPAPVAAAPAVVAVAEVRPIGTFDPEVFASIVGKAVAAAVEPLQKEIATIKGDVAKASATAADTAKKSATAIEQLQGLASRAPSKKGVGEVAPASTEPTPEMAAKAERTAEAQANLKRVAGF